jgi:hypothetical protein
MAASLQVKKPNLIFFDPPYFKKNGSPLHERKYFRFYKAPIFKHLFKLMREHSKPSTHKASPI